MSIKYFLYARKSSESEERQVQSIPDQIDRLTELAKEQNVEIVDVLTEAKSAKQPNARSMFNEMIDRIEKGEAEGILCWHINRLSRNPIDSGQISWLLQQGILQSIQTIDRKYLPTDNILIFSVESSQANQDIRDLRKNVMRGMESKLEKGWLPAVAPAGYLNNKDEGTIIIDPERYDLIKRAWQHMLTGSYTVPQIRNLLNKKWGFRTKKRKKIGGNPISLSGLYNIFTNSFYAGVFEYWGKEWEGSHEPMITLDELNRVQNILGRKGNPRAISYNFAYTGFIKCGECGCSITATRKTKYIQSTGETRVYIYYHCTHKRPCKQKIYVTEDKLEDQVDELLTSVTILPEFRDWAFEVLREDHAKEVAQRNQMTENHRKNLDSAQQQLDALIDMRCRSMVDDDEYMRKREFLTNEVATYRKEIDRVEDRADQWLKNTERVFDFAVHAHYNYTHGDLQTKKEILIALGKNPIIKDGELWLETKEWLQPIEEAYPALEEKYLRLELDETVDTKAKTRLLEPIISEWYAREDSNLRP